MNKYSIIYKFKIIQELIDLTFKSNSKSNTADFGLIYSKHLIQKIIHLGISEFLTDKNFNHLILKNRVETKNFIISRDRGLESISFKLIYKTLIQFFLIWSLFFFFYFFSLLFRKKKELRKKIIIFGTEHLDINNKEIISNFINFLKKHITVRKEYDILISSNLNKILKFENFIFKKYSHIIILNSGLGLKDFIEIQLLHFRYLYIFIRNIFKDRRSSVLAKDFAMMSLYDYANKKKLIKSMIFTNTNMNYQPLWSSDYINKDFSTSMFWYSENSSPIVCDIKNNTDYFNQYHPHISLLSIDYHYVWTNFFKNTLKKFTTFKKCYVIGPILWKLIKKNNSLLIKENSILVFDVTALSDQWMIDSGHSDLFYSYKNMKQFILDIVDSKNKIKALSKTKIILKPKRKIAHKNDMNYLAFLKKLEAENKIIIINSSSDIALEIEKALLVISVPFSSPLILANYLKKDCIYYDPTYSVIPYEGQKKFLIKGKKALYKKFLKINKRGVN